jgi:mono/diheme cytochrome c family protein
MMVGPTTYGRVQGRSIRIAFAMAGLTLAVVLIAPAAHASSKDDREQGAVLFHERGCEHCHGADAAGTDRGPDLRGVGRWLHKPEIELQIRNGSKSMPAFGDTLSNDEVQHLVAFLAAKKKKGIPRPVLTDAKS